MLSDLERTLQDARLGDAVLVLDGFEHILIDESGAGSDGWKIHLLLSRLMGEQP